MSLCPHGYSAFWDCPVCECPGCGRTQDGCVCHLEPRPPYHGAAGPQVHPIGCICESCSAGLEQDRIDPRDLPSSERAL